MKKLTIGQKKSLSNFYNNISVAWFTAGIIVPIASLKENIGDIVISFVLGGALSAFFLALSLQSSRTLR